MIQNSGDFSKHGPNPLRPLRDFNVQKLLDSHGEALLVGHHADIVQTVEIW
jgi:hypothetical protein